MLSRLRGNRHEAKPMAVNAAAEAVRQKEGGADGAAVVAGAVDPQSTVTKTLTIEEKAALLTDSLVDVAVEITMPFSRQELARIKRRFASMLLPDSLTATPMSACTTMPELSTSPFIPLLIQFISYPVITLLQGHHPPRKSPRKRNAATECITFDQFLTLLSILSARQSITAKRQVLFRIYDADRDGRVSVDDLVATLSAVTTSLSRTELRAAAATHFASSATDNDAGIGNDAFQQLFSDADVHGALTVAY